MCNKTTVEFYVAARNGRRFISPFSPRGATCGYNALCVNAQRFIGAFRPREAICPICLNRGLGRLSRGTDKKPRHHPTAAGVANSILHLAPEGRHVYRTRHTTNNQSPRGATCGYNALCVNAQRFIGAFRPREAICPICLNRGLGRLSRWHR